MGTGDFTHPAWQATLKERLRPAERGLFRLAEDVERDIAERLPVGCRRPVRFMLSVEISTIYKRDDKTRKVHHLLYAPTLEAAEEITRKLGKIGNLTADGRPILGLDSRDLLEITLSAGEGCYLVPAHIWTPWFAALGSKSGFDAIEDCYADLSDHIFAVETGLSSDPEMNWRLSGLDRYRLVSHSDAHSPPILGREATVFDAEVDYYAVLRSLRTGEGFDGTVEFFPEEGKYHLDGHRKCEVRLEPGETRERGGRCPGCGRPVTVGVLSRVEELADRDEGARPGGAARYRSLVPLPEIMGEILDVGPKSKKVARELDALVERLGPELPILEHVPVEEIRAAGSPLLAEAVERLRAGEVVREAGYDGEYGVIRVFQPGELRRAAGSETLFEPPAPAARPKPSAAKAAPVEPVGEVASGHPEAAGAAGPGTDAVSVEAGVLGGLDPDQAAAAGVTGGPLLVLAGPGTGKTRTLTHRIAHLVTDHGVPPERCLAITFTRRAAGELSERLQVLLEAGGDAAGTRPEVATFHALGLRVVQEQRAKLGLGETLRIAADADRLQIVRSLGAASGERAVRRQLAEIAQEKRAAALRRSAAAAGTAGADDTGASEASPEGGAEPGIGELTGRYQAALRERGLIDLDDLVALPVELLAGDPELVESYRRRWTHVSVDEYQDVDELQYRLLRLLSPPDGNLCAIGDPDQAIYGFRGADVGFFLRFQTDFPGATVVRLTRNYRSSGAIVNAALQAIAPSTLVRGRELRAVGGTSAPARIAVHEAASEAAEAEFIVATTEKLLGGSSFFALDSGRADGGGDLAWSFSDFAVLYRTDAQAGALLEAFTRAGMPVQKRSHDRLADRPGVKAVMSALQRDHHPVIDLEGAASLSGTPAGEGAGGLAGRLRAAAQAALDAQQAAVDGDPATAAALAADVHPSLELLLTLAERCGGDQERFLAELTLGAEVDAWDPRADRVSLLTLHAAKGLEFPVVFLAGCEDGLLPLRFGAGDAAGQDDTGEERRLFFVGLTRARSHLFLTHARKRTRYGQLQEATRSPFVAAIDGALLDVLRTRPAARRPARPEADQLSLL